MRKIFTLSLLFLYFTAFNQQISSPKDKKSEKVRGVKSIQEFFTEANQNAGLDYLEYLNTYGDKSTPNTELLKLAKKNRAAKGASKEELDFIEKEIQKEIEFERILLEQEKQLELQTRISKLSPEKQAIYFDWKKKGVDKLTELEKIEQEEKKQLALEKKKKEELKNILTDSIPIFVIIFLLFTFGMWRLYKNR